MSAYITANGGQLAGIPLGGPSADVEFGAGGSQVAKALALGYVYNPLASTWERLRTPSVFTSIQSTNISTALTIWTPAAGKKFRLMAIRLSISGEAIKAAGEGVRFNLLDNALGVFAGVDRVWRAWIPAAAPAAPLGVLFDSGWMVLPGNGYLSAAANNPLKLAGSGAADLTAGQLSVNMAGTEE